MDIECLVKLTSRAWSLEILALLNAGVPGRQAPLLAATSAGRTSFSASLQHLVHLRLLEKNPGHGHPLRPEFRLTRTGVEVAKIAGKIVNAVPDEVDVALLRRRWIVPILALTNTPRRFSVIKSDLVTVSDRALSSSLQQLESQAWILRAIDTSERVPFPTYRAVNRGLSINQAIDITV